MDRTTAEKLLPLINDKQMVDALLAYIEHRKNKIAHQSMITTEEYEGLFKGAYKELTRMETLREEVLKAKESPNA